MVTLRRINDTFVLVTELTQTNKVERDKRPIQRIRMLIVDIPKWNIGLERNFYNLNIFARQTHCRSFNSSISWPSAGTKLWTINIQKISHCIGYNNHNITIPSYITVMERYEHVYIREFPLAKSWRMKVTWMKCGRPIHTYCQWNLPCS
jgi:hypothetical protein